MVIVKFVSSRPGMDECISEKKKRKKKLIKNQTELSPSDCGGFTGTFWEAKMCPGFPPPQAALHIILSNEGVTVSIGSAVA